MQKKPSAEKLVFNKLLDQYIYLGLPIDKIDVKTEFTIHNLKDIHDTLPYKSPIYRTNFFSFVFAKNAKGKYTTDEQCPKT
ncbi:hypothetical protein CLV51_101213 [Chitinophaga niastensis]|uniref:Uncharacterized protein n=1 Tax=Chitinophaga niastensis TaxID=536980 RepID=A0A2P8HRS0_CHINA|nr:hypothetical protein [Chitinophaga niastensis]PSL48884.1 hypothetical protein CLV51_101213 [Chitinophaga niastensis]